MPCIFHYLCSLAAYWVHTFVGLLNFPRPYSRHKMDKCYLRRRGGCGRGGGTRIRVRTRALLRGARGRGGGGGGLRGIIVDFLPTGEAIRDVAVVGGGGLVRSMTSRRYPIHTHVPFRICSRNCFLCALSDFGIRVNSIWFFFFFSGGRR